MSDEDLKKTGEESDAENNEQDDDPENLGEEDGEEGEEDEDLDKPVTKKDLLDFRKGINSEINNRFAGKRHEQKSSKTYQPGSNKSDKVPLNDRLEAIEISNTKRDFGYLHQLSPKEVDLVFKFANNKPTAKTLEDPFVKGGLDRLRTQANLRDNTPSGSGSSSFEVGGKKWEDMNPEERKTNFKARQKAILISKSK